MAIRPRYAEAILRGDKRVEFRKRSLAPDVSTVVMYVTAPARHIVGEFTVAGTLAAPPSQLWDRLGTAGGIDEESYDAYFGLAEQAVGLLVGDVKVYPEAVALSDVSPELPVPQSFAYLTQAQWDQIHRRAGVPTESCSTVDLVTSERTTTAAMLPSM